MAFQLVRHALLMILRNAGQALRVSLGPLLIGGGVGVVFFMIVTTLPMSGPGFAVLILLLMTAIFFVLAWIAVAWHRFILLEEYSGLLPRFAMDQVGPYVRISFLLALIVFLCMLPLVFLAAPILQVADFLTARVITFLLGLVPSYLMFRFGLALPAAAIGAPMGLSQSWQATRPFQGVIWGVTAILVALNVLIELWASIPLAPTLFNQILQTVLALGMNWLTLMMGICVLTTLYGHLVEDRPLMG